MKKINWRHVALTALTVSNVMLVHSLHTAHKVEYDLRNELVTLDEEAGSYYSLYKNTLNELYLLEIETGVYNETPADQLGMKDPN